MANPRNTVSLEGIGIVLATLKVDGVTITYDKTQTGGIGGQTANSGLAVSLSADSTLQLAADGDAIVGKLVAVEADSKALVQIDGCTGFKGGSAAALTLGSAIVGALGVSAARGCVRSAASAVPAELIKCKGQILDAADVTNVMVSL